MSQMITMHWLAKEAARAAMNAGCVMASFTLRGVYAGFPTWVERVTSSQLMPEDGAHVVVELPLSNPLQLRHLPFDFVVDFIVPSIVSRALEAESAHSLEDSMRGLRPVTP